MYFLLQNGEFLLRNINGNAYKFTILI